MLQSYFLARDHFYICDKFAHGPTEKDEVYLCGYVSQLVCDEMAVTFLETCSQEAGQMLDENQYFITIYHRDNSLEMSNPIFWENKNTQNIVCWKLDSAF